MAAQRTYLAIDLKSFYASVECVDRHLDPLTTNLVVADASRTEKTICLAVSPSLKAYKIPGRARLFEAVQRVQEVNAQRLQTAIRQQKAVRGEDGKYHFASTSFDANALNADPALGLELHRCAAPDAAVSGRVHPDLQDLPQICVPGGYLPLLHRRGFH